MATILNTILMKRILIQQLNGKEKKQLHWKQKQSIETEILPLSCMISS